MGRVAEKLILVSGIMQFVNVGIAHSYLKSWEVEFVRIKTNFSQIDAAAATLISCGQ